MFEVRVTDQRIPAYTVVKGMTRSEAEAKAAAVRASWEERWQKKEAAKKARATKLLKENLLLTGKFRAQELTTEAQATIKALDSILVAGLTERVTDWEDLKDRSVFAIAAPRKPSPVDLASRPTEDSFAPALSFLDKLLSGRKARKIEEADANYAQALAAWDQEVQGLKALVNEESEEHQQVTRSWQQLKDDFKANQAAQHAAIHDLRAAYSLSDKAAVEYLISEALS
jgi:hypothetical protein